MTATEFRCVRSQTFVTRESINMTVRAIKNVGRTVNSFRCRKCGYFHIDEGVEVRRIPAPFREYRLTDGK